MPRSRNIFIGTTTIAFCASLTLHAFLVVTAVRLYAGERIFLPGFDRREIVGSKSDQIMIALPHVQPEPEPERDEKLGKSDGTGSALDDSPGDLPMLARKGPQDQALLSRDPAGAGRLHADLSDSTLPPGSAAIAGASPTDSPAGQTESREAQEEREAIEASIESPEQRAIPFGVGLIGEQPNDVPFDRPATPAREAQAAQPEVIASDSGAISTTAAPTKPNQTGTPGAPIAPADVAPQSDTESDPFTVIGAAQFRPGGTKAQLGRAHRLTYPRIGMSGLVDSVQIGRARLVVQITIDQTGKVKQATIFKSSGSESIDQACRITAYEWWFEPKKGKDGTPLKEEKFLFLITFA